MKLLITTLILQTILINALDLTTIINDHHSITGKEINNVLVVIAMEAEAKPFVDYLSLKEDTAFFPEQVPFKAFTGSHNDCDVTVVTNGKDEAHGEYKSMVLM